MRIGMITTSVPHRGDPVAGCFVASMARALGALGHDLRVLAVRRREGRGWDDPLAPEGYALRVVCAPGASLLYDGGAPERLRGPAGWSRAGALTTALMVTARRWLADRDALVSHFLVPGSLIAAAVRNGRPHLAIAHGSDGAVFAALPGPLRARLLRETTARWYTHRALRDRVDPTDHGALIAPMGFDRAVARTPRDDGALRVLVVARLVPVKDVARAVLAVAALREGGVDARLDVLGDGPDRPALQSLVTRALGAAGALHGAVDANTRDAFLARSDVLLHTARALPDGRTEGAPTAVVEAMGAGLCVVATDAGGVAELVGEGGVIVPEGASPAVIAAAMRGLAMDRSAREALGRKAMDRAVAWRWDRQAARVVALLGG